MLAGKLIGVGAVGLTQIAIWLVAGRLSWLRLLRRLCEPRLRDHFSLPEGILFPVYFVLGFPLYSSFFARPCGDLRNGAGAADVYAAGAAPTWTQLCDDLC